MFLLLVCPFFLGFGLFGFWTGDVSRFQKRLEPYIEFAWSLTVGDVCAGPGMSAELYLVDNCRSNEPQRVILMPLRMVQYN